DEHVRSHRLVGPERRGPGDLELVAPAKPAPARHRHVLMIRDGEMDVIGKDIRDRLEEHLRLRRCAEISHVLCEHLMKRTQLVRAEAYFDAFLSRSLDLAS